MKILCETKEEFNKIQDIVNRVFNNPDSVEGVAEINPLTCIINVDGPGDMSVLLNGAETKSVSYRDEVFIITLYDCVIRLRSKKINCKYTVTMS